MRRWLHKNFTVVNERISTVDLDINEQTIKIVAVYMPHTGYCDHAVDEVYEILDAIIREAWGKRTRLIFARDWNAKVGNSKLDIKIKTKNQ